MAVAHPTGEHGSSRMGGGPGWHYTEWLLGIVGGIAMFLGLFVLFASDDNSIGLGGEWSWQVGDISPAVTWGLLIGGGVLILGAVAMVVMGRHRAAPAAGGDRALTDLWWHTGAFLVVNAFLWIQDLALGDGVNYAYWVTIPWGIGLAIHAMAHLRARGRVDGARAHPG